MSQASKLAMDFQLTGSRRIILEEMGRLIEKGEDVSIMTLAARTAYHFTTVQSALTDLRELGLVEMRQPCPGAPADYSICEEMAI